MAESNGSSSPAGNVLSVISGSLASGVAIVVIASVVYEYFYFLVVGSQFLQLYSASDFIKLAVKWMPAFGLAASIGLWINFADMKERQRAYRKFGHEGLRQWNKADKSMDYVVKFICLTAIAAVPFMSWRRIIILQIPIYILITRVVLKLVVPDDEEIPHLRARFYGVSIFIFILVSAAFGGVSAAVTDLRRSDSTNEISFDGKLVDVILLKAIDKGVIYR